MARRNGIRRGPAPTLIGVPLVAITCVLFVGLGSAVRAGLPVDDQTERPRIPVGWIGGEESEAGADAGRKGRDRSGRASMTIPIDGAAIVEAIRSRGRRATGIARREGRPSQHGPRTGSSRDAPDSGAWDQDRPDAVEISAPAASIPANPGRAEENVGTGSGRSDPAVGEGSAALPTRELATNSRARGDRPAPDARDDTRVPPRSASRSDRATRSDDPTASRRRPESPDPDGFRLGPGDVIDVFVWKNPELSRQVPVRPDGRISLPLAGELQVADRTPPQVAAEIRRRLGEFVQVPEVTVSVAEINSFKVYVMGEVGTPGPLTLDRRTGVMQALAMAGGLTEFADRDDIVIHRESGGRKVRIPFDYEKVVEGEEDAPDVELRSGDLIYVP